MVVRIPIVLIPDGVRFVIAPALRRDDDRRVSRHFRDLGLDVIPQMTHAVICTMQAREVTGEVAVATIHRAHVHNGDRWLEPFHHFTCVTDGLRIAVVMNRWMCDCPVLRFLEHFHHEGFDILLLLGRIANAHLRFAHQVETVVEEGLHFVHRPQLILRVIDLGVAQVLITKRAERDVRREKIGAITRTIFRVCAVVQQGNAVADAVPYEPCLGCWHTRVATQVFEDRRIQRLLRKALSGGLRAL